MEYRVTFKDKYNKNKSIIIESNSVLATISLIYELYGFVDIQSIKKITGA